MVVTDGGACDDDSVWACSKAVSWACRSGSPLCRTTEPAVVGMDSAEEIWLSASGVRLTPPFQGIDTLVLCWPVTTRRVGSDTSSSTLLAVVNLLATLESFLNMRTSGSCWASSVVVTFSVVDDGTRKSDEPAIIVRFKSTVANKSVLEKKKKQRKVYGREILVAVSQSHIEGKKRENAVDSYLTNCINSLVVAAGQSGDGLERGARRLIGGAVTASAE